MTTNPYGKRLTFHQAAAYLDMPESRLRRLIRERRIPFSRSDGRTLQRRRNGVSEPYVKSGRIELFTADCDAYLASRRVEAIGAPPKSANAPRAVDQRVAELIREMGAR